jgi:hypothetical protein
LSVVNHGKIQLSVGRNTKRRAIKRVSKFLDMQQQILDAIRNIAHRYNEAQKDIVNWWCEVAQIQYEKLLFLL